MTNEDVYELLRLKPDAARISLNRPGTWNQSKAVPKAWRNHSRGFALKRGIVFLSMYDSSYHSTNPALVRLMDTIYSNLNYTKLLSSIRLEDSIKLSPKYLKLVKTYKNYLLRITDISELPNQQILMTVEANVMAPMAGTLAIKSLTLLATYNKTTGHLTAEYPKDVNTCFFETFLGAAGQYLVYHNGMDTVLLRAASSSAELVYRFTLPMAEAALIKKGNLLTVSSDSVLKGIYLDGTPKAIDLSWLAPKKGGFRVINAMHTTQSGIHTLISVGNALTYYKLHPKHKKALSSKPILNAADKLSNVVYYQDSFWWVDKSGRLAGHKIL